MVEAGSCMRPRSYRRTKSIKILEVFHANQHIQPDSKELTPAHSRRSIKPQACIQSRGQEQQHFERDKLSARALEPEPASPAKQGQYFSADQ